MALDDGGIPADAKAGVSQFQAVWNLLDSLKDLQKDRLAVVKRAWVHRKALDADSR